jgi:gamma-glutamyl hercynylcysteine S-oxide synthase
MLTAFPDVVTSQPLLERLLDARRQSDALFSIVRPDALYDRPIPERNRIIFYIGHLEAFDWNLLHEVLGLKSFHPEFDKLFAFGIDPVGGGLPTDQPSDWPSLRVVRDYVKKLGAALDEGLSSALLDPQAYSRDGFDLNTLLHVAIEHRLMHVETLAYMLHQLPLASKIPHSTAPVQAVSAIVPRMVDIPAGVAALGLTRDSEVFGWDNEFEKHLVHVPAFQIDQFMVSNRQFLDFMNAGGYETRAFWDDESWNWKTAESVAHPVFWKRTGNAWLYRTMFEEIPLPLDWPVYVSHAEASAYARWAGKSLPTEAQWQRAAYGMPDGVQHIPTERYYPWGNETPDPNRGNFDFYRWDPAPVNSSPQGQSAFGVHGMLGNGWEWTSTVFGPLPGFKPFPFYPGYSANFYDGQHYVIKGGSARTAGCMLRPTFRNWFQAHYQYVYAGFRCVNRSLQNQ